MLNFVFTLVVNYLSINYYYYSFLQFLSVSGSSMLFHVYDILCQNIEIESMGSPNAD